MPTSLTHALCGAALAQATPAGVPRRRCVAVLAVLAIIPDVDVASFWTGAHGMLWHRGVTHSLVFAACLGVGAGLACPEARRRGWRVVACISLLAWVAAASHGVLDAATSGGDGVGLLMPFSDQRFFFTWRPIVVSPIRPGTFWALASRVLRSEALWVWTPLVALSGLSLALRFVAHRLARRPGLDSVAGCRRERVGIEPDRITDHGAPRRRRDSALVAPGVGGVVKLRRSSR